MQWALLFAGLVLLVGTNLDLIWTTLSLNGAGPLTGALSRAIGGRLLRSDPWWPFGWLGSHVGLVVILTILASWILLTWTGWALIFSAAEHAVVESQSGRPADASGRVYFAGYALITLGVGDYRPHGAAWQVATILASINGFVLVSLSISYLVPILAAAVEGRRLALSIAHLGETPEDLVARAWDGGNFELLSQHLMALAPALVLVGQRLLTYPILLYFRSSEPRASFPLGLASLDESLTLLERGVVPEHRPGMMALDPARRAIAETLETLTALTAMEPAREAPPPPSLASLRAAGVPTVDDAAFGAAVAGLDERRKRLLGLVRWQGQTWRSRPPDQAAPDR